MLLITRFILMVFMCGGVANADKAKVDVLTFLPLTGDLPRTGEACRAAVDLVFNEINARTDILPDYHLQAVIVDEGKMAMDTVNNAYAFIDEYQPGTTKFNDQNLLLSPIILGVWWAPGCVAFSNQLQHLNMVQIAFGCGTPEITAKSEYSNLYRVRSTGEVVAYSQLHFIKETFGNRFGILTYALNSFDYTLASYLFMEAVANNFEVAFFDTVPDINDYVIGQLKASDARIIVIDMAIPPVIMKTLCLAYKNGITGSRYTFILMFAAYFDPNLLPEFVDAAGCSREVIKTQIEQSIWIAWSSSGDEPEKVTSLGYSTNEFDRKFEEFTNHRNLADSDKRASCGDGALAAVLAMEDANRKLKSMGMSLMNYKTSPELVGKMVNDSVRYINFTSLRLSKYIYNDWSEMEGDNFVAAQWTREHGRQFLYSFKHMEGYPINNLTSYKARKIQDPIWIGGNGQAPRDRTQSVFTRSEVTAGTFIVMLVLAIILTIYELMTLVVSIRRQMKNGSVDKIGYPTTLVSIIIGCIALNASAAAFASPANSESSNVGCILQRVFVMFGLCSIQGGIFLAVLFHKSINSEKFNWKPNKSTSSLAIFSGSQAGTSNRKEKRVSNLTVETPTTRSKVFDPSSFIQRHKRYTIYGLGFLYFICICFLLIWMIWSTPVYRHENLTPNGIYDYQTDTLTFIDIYNCHSDHETPFVIVGAIFFAIVNGWTMMAVYSLRNSNQHEYYTNLKLIRLAAVVVMSLFGGVILITIIFNQSPTNQKLTISIFSLLFSAIVSTILNWNVFANA